MAGSGMNTAAVDWHILQTTHSEQLLGILVVAQALPSLLLIYFFTYVFSFSCYLLLRKGRQTIAVHTARHIGHPVRRFFHEAGAALVFVRARRSLGFLGSTWAFFVAAMMVTAVVTAPISGRIVHAGAMDYGWLNAGWGVGAFFSTLYAARTTQRFGWRTIIPASMTVPAALVPLAQPRGRRT